MSQFIACIPVSLPLEQQPEAINIAANHNPANQIPLFNIPRETGDREIMSLEPAQIVMLRTSYWGPKGVNLGVSFLDNPTVACRNKILQYANMWGQHANIKFFYSTNGEIRISRTRGGGYWSYLGTDILSIKPGQPTMNLDSFTENTSDQEYSRVVCHEFGHTLGFPHEHMRKEIVDQIDPQRAIAYFKKVAGWPANMTQSQVLTPLPPSSVVGTKNAMENSIMCYQLPGSIMKDGQDVPGGNMIDVVDHDLARKLYPNL